MEERWTALWGAYEALNRSPDARDDRNTMGGGDGSLGGGSLGGGGGGGGGGRDTSSTPPPVVDSLRARLVDATGSGGGEVESFARHIGRNLGLGSNNPLLEAASAIGLFSPFGAPQLAPRSTGTHPLNTITPSHLSSKVPSHNIPFIIHHHNTPSHISHNPPTHPPSPHRRRGHTSRCDRSDDRYGFT